MRVTTSWKKACAVSALTHCLVIGTFGLVMSTLLTEHSKEFYTVDLDVSSTATAGSGYAGGGGVSFPEPLTEEALHAKETIGESNIADSSLTSPNVSSVGPAAPRAVSGAPISGNGSGGGTGSGKGTGSGDGVGSGHGYGEGSGAGQGSGDSGAVGTGTAPFDVQGFWSVLNQNKEYPYMAVRRGIEGTVGLAISLDGDGNLMSVEVVSSSGSSLLDEAAVAGARKSCPYPNASGRPISIETTVVFKLQ